jgi:micrococcal nuclease
VAEVQSRKIETRLYGVDSPEYNQPFSGLAKAFSRRAVLGRQVTVDPRCTDRYDRVVAVVDRGGGLLDADLVAAGFAWDSPRYCRLRVCREWQELETRARSKRAGLWQEPAPVPPWRWKEKSREKSLSRFSSKNWSKSKTGSQDNSTGRAAARRLKNHVITTYEDRVLRRGFLPGIIGWRYR